MKLIHQITFGPRVVLLDPFIHLFPACIHAYPHVTKLIKNLERKGPKKTKKTSKINSYRQASQWPRDDATSDESEIIIVKPSHQTPHRE